MFTPSSSSQPVSVPITVDAGDVDGDNSSPILPPAPAGEPAAPGPEGTSGPPPSHFEGDDADAPPEDSEPTGPTTIPAQEDPEHPDMYVPPWDGESDLGEKQYQLRYDPETETYVVIAEVDEVTGQWRTYDQKEFEEFNNGHESIVPMSSDKVVTKNGQKMIVRIDPKTKKEIVVGFVIGDEKIYLPSMETARGVSRAGTEFFTEIPPHSPEDEIYVPPHNADGTLPDVQYILIRDPDTGLYVTIGEIHHGDTVSYEYYTLEEFKAANASIENNFYTPDLPPEDSSHLDFTRKYGNITYLYRYIDGEYKIIGFFKEDDVVYYLDNKSIEEYNEGATPPPAPEETTLGDMPTDTTEDMLVPPEGETQYIFRFNPANNTWFIVGESTQDANHYYDEKEFQKANSNYEITEPKDGDFQAIGTNLICRVDDNGKVIIVGIAKGGTSYYFDKETVDKINKGDNVQSPLEPMNPPAPVEGPPPAGAGGPHPDFESPSDQPDILYIWRWDPTLGRYCIVGMRHIPDDRPATIYIFTPEEYQYYNSGPDRVLPPEDEASFVYPEFTDDPPRVDTTQEVSVFIYGSKAGEEGDSATGHPVYKMTTDGYEVEVGIQLEDGSIYYYSKEQYENAND